MKVAELWQKKKQILMGFLLAIFVTACAGGAMIGVGCEVYAQHRLNMPDPIGATKEFLSWLNLLDVNMLEVCRRG